MTGRIKPEDAAQIRRRTESPPTRPKKGSPPKDAIAREPALTAHQREQLERTIQGELTPEQIQQIRNRISQASKDTALELRRELLAIAKLLAPRARKEAGKGQVRLVRLLMRLYRTCRD